jgi:hypothetical protein
MHAPAGFAKHAVFNPNCQTTKTALPRRKPASACGSALLGGANAPVAPPKPFLGRQKAVNAARFCGNIARCRSIRGVNA